MADKRAYFKVDVGYMMNPKIAALAAERPTAVLLHLASIGYAAQHLTDGVVPVSLMLRIAAAEKEDAAALYEAGLWHDVGPGKAEVHDFLEHQRSAAEAKEASEQARRAAEARHRKAEHAHRSAEGMPDACDEHADSTADSVPREREERDIKNVADSDESGRAEVDGLCDLLADLIEGNGSKRPRITKGWRDSARLLLDRDGRSHEEACALIRWCQAHEFWRGNILSMPKFREKFDQLRLQAQRDGGLKVSGDPTDWLRRMWQDANVAEVRAETGLTCQDPDLPPSLSTREEISEFLTQSRRKWIQDNRDVILSRMSEGRAA